MTKSIYLVLTSFDACLYSVADCGRGPFARILHFPDAFLDLAGFLDAADVDSHSFGAAAALPPCRRNL